MRYIEFEGKTSQDAIKKAVEKFKVSDSSKLRIEIIEEGKSGGIFGFGSSKPAKIKAALVVENINIASDSKRILLEILANMGFQSNVKNIDESETKLYIELESSENSGLIIGKKGKTLEALQYIVNLMVGNETGSEKRIILDIEDYRGKREQALKAMSKEIASKVIKTGKPWILEPMNPFERRLVHLSLQDDKRVFTKSEGQGIYRKIKIFPAK
jgi:spoIIIJ-associated protein